MSPIPDELASLNKEDLTAFVIELFHRTIVHYGMWFQEVQHQMDSQTFAQIESQVFATSMAVQMRRLGKLLGFEVDKQGIPEKLKAMSKEELLDLAKGQGVNWLANDGIWFQKVESSHNMDSAKRINDTCWTQYSPYEARRIKEFLDLGDHSGLAGLKRALSYRNYALVNKQSIHDVDENTFVFQMNECRVQVARQRKGLPDYPCSSVGNVEYPYFAKAIDSRIKTRCVGCPPGEHPKEWFCAWEFSLKKS